MAFDYDTVREVASKADTDALIRSLKILADRNTEDARLRAGVINDELSARAADDIELNG